MLRHQFRFARKLAFLILCVSPSLLLTQCSDDPVAPDPPENIAIAAGDQQYSYKGTPLPRPLVVRVTTANGDVPEQAHVRFTVLAGNGTVSRSTVDVNKQGLASTEYTLGTEVGTNIINAAIEENSSKSVQFMATSANFYCPEQEDTFRVSYGTEHLFLGTHKSSLYPAVGSSGVVRADALRLRTINRFVELPAVQTFDSRIYDVAFSARGDLYLARLALASEILKIDLNGNYSHFATLEEVLPEPDPAVEIATNPSGLLIGCDVMGPFVVGCRELITRLDGATFPNGGVNNDALAADPRRQSEDPLGEDIYFIYKPESSLRRLPMDSLTVDGDESERVAFLTEDQANSARGMVCYKDGTVFILVDSDETKQLLSVTPDGTVDVLVDFMAELGPYEQAAVNRDLAIDGELGLIYTLDTLNNDILLYSLDQRSLTHRFQNVAPLTREGLSLEAAIGERVGLVVLQ